MTKYILKSIMLIFLITSCNSERNQHKKKKEFVEVSSNANDIIPFFQYWNLILGDGSNVGQATNYENKDFFYTVKDDRENWVVFKSPNAGNTHGTSNNTRTELAQLKKWSPLTDAKMNATLKVMNVSSTGDARVAATYSVVVGQIHSADGHENEPLKIFYKKFPGHTKGSVFWNYEINTSGDDNSGRWDFSYPIWGYDFSVVGTGENTYPSEPEDGIELGEEFSYEVEIRDGLMHLKFTSKGHETKTFTKNLIATEYANRSDIPEQVENLFVPIGQDGVEREKAYTGEGLFFKLGCYNQTNGKDPKVNKIWCNGAETHGGDIKKQYSDGNYAEVWFKTANIEISEDAYSNEGYFEANDGLSKKTVYPHEVIPFMDKFKILLGDGTNVENLVDFENKEFFYTVIDGTRRWVVYKTPNSGVTSKNSSNTRTELHEKREWTPEEGGKLTGTCKVMQVSVSGDARVAASYSVVVGQIHSGEGHENEPLKIFYKKFPGHEKGSVFWNYEINTAGNDNSGRWDYSTAVWGNDMSVVGTEKNDFPTEPADGIELGEEFSYEVNVYEGIMYLTFKSEGHETKTFTKNLVESEYIRKSDIPAQVQKLFVPIGQDGLERSVAYSNELNYFKQGAYNQTNGKNPDTNMVWCAGAETYNGDITKQYQNGCYAEVWFREATVGLGTPPQ
ncbi:polysaccharide lyase family 7 protein [Ichthyenterobacterium sp. W332]|uniref:Polysaccharide lyase family 7 protein n=1 Tax=Microcosmobacter mediterraneus TaxID=3075607 RepID=A0ABU2YM18_9FLAO|nr:polysaccharide lyase family 7 protein [Ichthyenterobacterium sp. W332]MDT0558941.1 polysaccharide lyase family 7 protein [Ichthyenterobacterium sp. W332]